MTYPKVSHTDATSVPASPRFPSIEEAVLAYWEKDGTFQASIDQRPTRADGGDEFVFYDGPPFANGLPHYGHLLTGYVKDLIPRYQTMRGKRVERRFGWDTHGLPAELEAMRQLGLKTTDEIHELGIERFNEACRASVLKYADEWQRYVTRQARWVDFDNDYRTMNPEFMESVIWAFKQLHEKGLVYEGFRILPYCWNDETPLSNHELRMDDDVYKMRQDPALTVGFKLADSDDAADPLNGANVLIWTTTPWTLPSNMGVAVGPDVTYALVESTGEVAGRFLLAEGRVAAYKKELGEEATVVATFTGAELAGRRYLPPFSYYAGADNAHRVLVADFVTTEDGTGIVHLAPGFGEDDKAVLDAAGVETVVPVGKDGKFTFPVEEYAGLQVFDANKPVIADLKATTGKVTPGTVLFRQETYDHSYPHCWRCRQPLIYMAVSSWFVEVTKFKGRMGELNEQISWTPDHIKHGQFGKWVENARDWSITRNRFWGSPVPVWKSDNPEYPRVDVYGSFAELEKDFGVEVTDLHRPYVDDLTRPNPDDPTGQSTMRRVTDVLDVWFDSGSMSFAQNHYPFENADWFEANFPADFIVEYIGQTRGWFYTLHILATALFDRPAFKSCVSHGIVLGSDGQKMSKSLRNYPDVAEVFDRDGADAMRWFLMSSPILRGGNLVVTEQGIRDSVRQVLIPLWSSWYFFQLYANAADYTATRRTDSSDPLDRYLLAKLRDFVGEVTVQLDAYDVANACESTRGFIDVLTNWYIRRSRERFWVADGVVTADNEAAFDTLYTVLETVCRVLAPLAPLTVEEIWRGLTGERSVHLADWPSVDDLPEDEELVAAMDVVRDVCSATSALRKANNLRNRLPLAGLTVVSDLDLSAFAGIVADEVNVKSVQLVAADSDEASAYGVEQKLTVNARAAGPRLGKDVQLAIKGSKTGDWSVDAAGVVTAGGLALVEGEYTLETVAGDASGGTATGVLPRGGFVVLDTVLTDELEAEGAARDLIRAIQQARKDAGLEVSDRIVLSITAPRGLLDAAEAHQDLVAGETLAVATEYAEGPILAVQVAVANA
ncbi:isoleucine--tRNA ligase [Nocardioides jejuensis]|uniref:Isoleucine--tRNA ligase n=1 Tax=Nocardioides jejuensis TaxID=2502782 RepID=A0A4R1C2V7_9ACTN|nr:isoleucine--tRNA ligase [Nocardioides jejuensis]TCJ24096.1 isoleucine--tRNA ligase [Nocardioides jejuensis]